MADLAVYVAVIGRFQLMPGVLPVALDNPKVDCLVAHAFPKTIDDNERDLHIDVTDCTVFTVTHRDQGGLDVLNSKNAEQIFQQSLEAISEVAIWSKAHAVVHGRGSSFVRQIGTTDVKACLIETEAQGLLAWLNPAFQIHRDAAAAMAGLLSNVVVTNGPSATPVPPVYRRVMGSLDLINLGFFTESFVNLFSLVDDLTQEVVKAGMAMRGMAEESQKSLLRAIKEERLKVYLCDLSKLCGWQSLLEADKPLFNDLTRVNATRNRIMHGSRRLNRPETIESCSVLLRAISWLRSNPFEFQIPALPELQVAEAVFSVVPAAETKSELMSEGNDTDSQAKA